MRRALVLSLLLAGCATAGQGRTSDRIVGTLFLSGTEQPIGGARIVLVPTDPFDRRADNDEDPSLLGVEATTNDVGGFALDNLTGGERQRTLLRGWEYEIRAEAAGFYTEVATVRYERGELALALQIDLIDDDEMKGENLLEMSSEAVDNPKGTLIREVLRRQGRLPLSEQ
jgi:hypothetical protein